MRVITSTCPVIMITTMKMSVRNCVFGLNKCSSSQRNKGLPLVKDTMCQRRGKQLLWLSWRFSLRMSLLPKRTDFCVDCVDLELE
jgi:hypothetical protein